ncbi:RNA polymerase sigma-70 factor [Puteibacter caeruleilacunae]|nr:RNA polymerase sigma-70 factor [Puteibacter caeruleilacunae]
MDNSEKQLIEDLRRGDKRAYESLFQEYYASLCVYAEKYVIDPDIAEEVVSAVICDLYEKGKAIKIYTSLKAYLFAAVKNRSLNYLKSSRFKELQSTQGISEENTVEFASGELIDETLIGKEVEKEILSIIAELPEQCRKVLTLSRFEGKKYREIAEILGISVNTVETQMSRALSKLRTSLRKYLHMLMLL